MNRRGPRKPTPKPFTPKRGEFAGQTFRSKKQYERALYLGYVPAKPQLISSQKRTPGSWRLREPKRWLARFDLTDSNGNVHIMLLPSDTRPTQAEMDDEIKAKKEIIEEEYNVSIPKIENVYLKMLVK